MPARRGLAEAKIGQNRPIWPIMTLDFLIRLNYTPSIMERILLLPTGEEIRDDQEIQQWLDTCHTPRDMEYVRSMLGNGPVTPDQLLPIDPETGAVLKMVIGQRNACK